MQPASLLLRRPHVLVVGCGDVGLRVLRLLAPRLQAQRVRVTVLTSSSARVPELRALGVRPLVGDLDQAATLRRLAGLADWVLHLAPPPLKGVEDRRTQALLQALALRRLPSRLVYASTTGVYGDAEGAWVDECRPVSPESDRAFRRVDAEQQLRCWGRTLRVTTTVLRIPGIYAPDREGGHPKERLLRGTPVLAPEDDVYTNHIHADDLARALWLACFKGRPGRVVNVCDDADLKMGDYMDMVADLCGLPRPQRVKRAQAGAYFSPMQMSFLRESRRIGNARLKKELGLRLRYPTVRDAL